MSNRSKACFSALTSEISTGEKKADLLNLLNERANGIGRARYGKRSKWNDDSMIR